MQLLGYGEITCNNSFSCNAVRGHPPLPRAMIKSNSWELGERIFRGALKWIIAQYLHAYDGNSLRNYGNSQIQDEVQRF